MAKRHQQRPAKESHGRNQPEKSTVITTGSYKKEETYRAQALAHEPTNRRAQSAGVSPTRVIPPEVTTKKQDSRARMARGERRSGSDSNAHRGRKNSRLHETAERQPEARPEQVDEFIEDIRPDNFAGANVGPRQGPRDLGLHARDIKELYGTLADLTDDELDALVIVPVGERLEQGAKYIDLQHLEQGEFVAMADMFSDEDHYYVAKKQTDYVLWNRLNQVSNPARLDEPDTPRE
jgi:hypothetical protein